MDEELPLKIWAIFMFIVMGIGLIGMLIAIPFSIIDSIHKYPIAAEKANKYCLQRGFDFYDDFERIGILSEDPIAIKCKYAEQNLNVRDRR